MIRPKVERSGTSSDWKTLCFFPVLLAMLGMVSLWTNLFNIWGPAPQRFLYVTLVFSFLLVFSMLALLLWKRRVPRRAFLWGQVLGITNALVIVGLLGALRSETFAHHSAIAYSLHSVSVMLLGTLIGVGIWRERMSRRNWAVIGFAVAVVIALNLR